MGRNVYPPKRKNAVRWRASSQHQLAYERKRNDDARGIRSRRPRRLVRWSLLCILWIVLWIMIKWIMQEKTNSLRGQVKSYSFSSQEEILLEESLRLCPAAPLAYRRRFYSRPKNTAFSTAMLRDGWQQTSKFKEAEILWYQQKNKIQWNELHCWQAVNHLASENKMSHKGHLIDELRKTNATHALKFLPETYALWRAEDRTAFVKTVIADQTNRNMNSTHPGWVLKEPAVDGGKGVQVIEDPTTLLVQKNNNETSVLAKHHKKLIQRYVKNLLLLDGHKFDLRVYWSIAAIEPEPLILYYGGTLRVSLDAFDAKNGSRGQHLTNAAQQTGGHDRNKSSELSRQPMSVLWNLVENSPRRYTNWPNHIAQNPRAHLECQIRQAIISMWQAFAPTLLQAHSTHHADVFALLGCDIMLDHDLNLFISELQSGPGLPSNTIAVRKIIQSMLPDLARIARIMHSSQGRLHRYASPVTRNPPLGGFQVLVNGSQVAPQPWCHSSSSFSALAATARSRFLSSLSSPSWW